MEAETIWIQEVVLVAFAIINSFLARKLEKSPWVWGILTIIPLIGFIVNYILLYMTLFSLLESIEVLESHRLHAARPGSTASS
jgi:hypothetical protein